jgi:hypothetical protein
VRGIIALAFVIAASLAGCASVQVDPQPAVATTLAPFNAQIGFNWISVPSGSRLLAASVDGKPAFCTIQPAWFALGEARRVCFTDDARSGYLSHYYVLGTLRSLTYDANIPYALDPGGIVGLEAMAPSQLTREDVLYCQMQGQMTSGIADQGHGGIIYSAPNAAVAGAQVRNTCLQMRAAAHQQQSVQAPPPTAGSARSY